MKKAAGHARGGSPHGVLPSQTLKELFASGFIEGVPEKYINPASVDLPLSDEAYRLESIFLPLVGEKVRPLIKKVGGIRYDLKNPLEVGVPYLIRVEGNFNLPENVYAYANPKSSTGRINLFCRTVADGEAMYDALSHTGWSGELWIQVRAESFPVLITPGQAVSQLRLFDGKTFLDRLELNMALHQYGIFFHPGGRPWERGKHLRHADSLLLSLLVEKGMAGWECRGSTKVFDFGKIDHYQPEDFFTPVAVQDGRVRLLKGSFYILSTYERVVVPPHLSAELRAIDPRFGEFRSHSAGYIDPGWGWGKNGEQKGRPITLEINPYETMYAANRQTIARIRYEHMREVPVVPYDLANSNYTKQNRGAALSKHFKKKR
jgi:dCTP deaminase